MMFCDLVVAARPKTRMSMETIRSITVTMMDFLFLLLNDPGKDNRVGRCHGITGPSLEQHLVTPFILGTFVLG